MVSQDYLQVNRLAIFAYQNLALTTFPICDNIFTISCIRFVALVAVEHQTVIVCLYKKLEMAGAADPIRYEYWHNWCNL
jgi:hypothetical protein